MSYTSSSGATPRTSIAIPHILRFPRSSQHRLDTLIDIFVRRCPVTHADAHRAAVLPTGPAAPAGSIFLDSRNGPLSFFPRTERHQNLVQYHVIQHFMP